MESLHEVDTAMPIVNKLIEAIQELQKQGTGVALLQGDNGKFSVVLSEDHQGVLIEANKGDDMPNFVDQFNEWKEEDL